MAVSLHNVQSQMDLIRGELAALYAEDESLTKELASVREQIIQLEAETASKLAEYKDLAATAAKMRVCLLENPAGDLTLDPLRPEINAAISRIDALTTRILSVKVSAELIEVRNQSLKMRIQIASADMEKFENELTALL